MDHQSNGVFGFLGKKKSWRPQWNISIFKVWIFFIASWDILMKNHQLECKHDYSGHRMEDLGKEVQKGNVPRDISNGQETLTSTGSSQEDGIFWYLMKPIGILKGTRWHALFLDSAEEVYMTTISTSQKNFRNLLYRIKKFVFEGFIIKDITCNEASVEQ